MAGEPGLAVLAAQLRAGDRRALAQAITLVESSLPADRRSARSLVTQLTDRREPVLRLAITGAPGVGKSTLIEALGTHALDQGRRVAVTAVDPTSQLTGGSILGDKTRMGTLAAQPRAFVRPSPSGSIGGGVAERTREVLLLFESAGFDTLFVETVGVGQGEQAVRNLVDTCLVVLMAGAGDELSTIKRGLLELGDIFAVNKADGPQVALVEAARGAYENALSLLLGGEPPVLAVSAREGRGVHELWREVEAHHAELVQSGALAERQRAQRRVWFEELVRQELSSLLLEQPQARGDLEVLALRVERGELDPLAAADLWGAALRARLGLG